MLIIYVRGGGGRVRKNVSKQIVEMQHTTALMQQDICIDVYLGFVCKVKRHFTFPSTYHLVFWLVKDLVVSIMPDSFVKTRAS